MRWIHGRIYTVEDGVLSDGYLETEGGVIKAVGPMDEIKPSLGDIDLEGACILPGLVDAHTSLGLKEDSMRREGNDWNEHGWIIGTELRAADGFNPQDRAVRYALEGGITTVAVAPGNENLIGGQVALARLCVSSPGEMIADPFCALKMSLGEQTKGNGVPPCTRMAIGAMLRQCLRDGGQDAAVKAVLQRKKPVFIHANRCDDIAFAVRLSWEFGFRCVIVHGADALLAADLLRESDIPVLAGSILLTPDSYETRNMDMDLPAGLERAGVRFALTTDHHLSPIQSLSVAAALAVRDGLREDRALEAVTLEPAKLLGVDGRIGSLRAGKDADFVIWSGSPFSYRSRVQKVFIRGKLEAEF